MSTKKVSRMLFFAITLKIVNKFPSGSCCNQWGRVCVETIHFTWRVYPHYRVMLRETELWQKY